MPASRNQRPYQSIERSDELRVVRRMLLIMDGKRPAQQRLGLRRPAEGGVG